MKRVVFILVLVCVASLIGLSGSAFPKVSHFAEGNQKDAVAEGVFLYPVMLEPNTSYDFQFRLTNDAAGMGDIRITRLEMFSPSTSYFIDESSLRAPDAIHSGVWTTEPISDSGYFGVRWQYNDPQNLGDIDPGASLDGFIFNGTVDAWASDGFPWAVWWDDGSFYWTTACVIAGCDPADDDVDDDTIYPDDDTGPSAEAAFLSPAWLEPITSYDFELRITNDAQGLGDIRIYRLEMYAPSTSWVIDESSLVVPYAIHSGSWATEMIWDAGYPGIRWLYADPQGGDIGPGVSLAGFIFNATADVSASDGFPWAVWWDDGSFFQGEVCVFEGCNGPVDDDIGDDTGTTDDDTDDDTSNPDDDGNDDTAGQDDDLLVDDDANPDDTEAGADDAAMDDDEAGPSNGDNSGGNCCG